MHTTAMSRRSALRTLTTTAALAVAGVVLAACGGTSSGSTAAPSGASTTAPASTSAAVAGVTLKDGWIKTAKAGDMTAVFGTLMNGGTTAATVQSGMSDVAKMVELHEVVMKDGKMQMQPKQGGFEIPAGGTHVLEPGHDHIMVMGLTKDLVAGDMVTVSLTLSDGTKVALDVVAKDFTGANETYAPTASMTSGM